MTKVQKKSILTKEDVLHIAKLACLELSEEEVQTYIVQLSDVLSYVEQLEVLPTKDVEATAQVTGLTNVFREDEITPSLCQEDALKNAPEQYKGYFKVKSVFGE